MLTHPERARIRPLFDESTLQARIAEMGAEITADYAGKHPVLVCVLKGSLPFVAALGRAIDAPVTYDYVAVSSYSGTESRGSLRFEADLSTDITGRHVILVEDIVDTGLTLSSLAAALRQRNPESLRIATLLDKPSRRRNEVDVAWRGFEIPDEFVVGFGLDYEQFFRNLPFIGVLENPGDLGAID